MANITFKPLTYLAEPERLTRSDVYSRDLAYGTPSPPDGVNPDWQPHQNLGYPWPGMAPLSIANNGKAYAHVGGTVQPSPVIQAGGPGNDGRWGANAIRAWLLGMRAMFPAGSA